MRDLPNVEQTSVERNQILAMRVALRDPSQATGDFRSSPGRPRRHNAIGTVDEGTVAKRNDQATGDNALKVLPAQARRLRVVIVEDDAIVAIDLEMLLEDLKADVVGIATNAADACALVLKHQPDFVTMDINIKGDRDGVSAAQEIFEICRVRSIFISSYCDPATQNRAAACHAIAWIKKPINTADLAKAVGLAKRHS